MKLDELLAVLGVLRSQHGGDIEVVCPVNGYDHDYSAVCDGAELQHEKGLPPAIVFVAGQDWSVWAQRPGER